MGSSRAPRARRVRPGLPRLPRGGARPGSGARPALRDRFPPGRLEPVHRRRRSPRLDPRAGGARPARPGSVRRRGAERRSRRQAHEPPLAHEHLEARGRHHGDPVLRWGCLRAPGARRHGVDPVLPPGSLRGIRARGSSEARAHRRGRGLRPHERAARRLPRVPRPGERPVHVRPGRRDPDAVRRHGRRLGVRPRGPRVPADDARPADYRPAHHQPRRCERVAAQALLPLAAARRLGRAERPTRAAATRLLHRGRRPTGLVRRGSFTAVPVPHRS